MAAGARDGITLREKQTSEGRFIQYARFVIPEKTKAGKIQWKRVERSTRVTSATQARQIAKALKDEAFKKAFSNEQEESGRTFADAALAYIRLNGPKIHLTPILERIGNMALDAIDTEFVTGLAEEMHPGCSPATHNRQVFTPIIAVVRSAETKEWKPPTFKRPQDWLPKSNWKEPPKGWWKAVTAAASPQLAALILFLRLHGRRTSEATSLRPCNVDRETWIVTVTDTKTGQFISFKLAQPVIDALQRYPWWQQTTKPRGRRVKDGSKPELRIFGFSSRWSVYAQLRKVCKAAGVPYHVPKDAGRHEFASSLLRAGKTLRELQDAGRWADIRAPARIYGHLEEQAVDAAAREIGEAWHSEQEARGEVVALKRKDK